MLNSTTPRRSVHAFSKAKVHATRICKKTATEYMWHVQLKINFAQFLVSLDLLVARLVAILYLISKSAIDL